MLFTFTLILTAINLAIFVYSYTNDDNKIPNLDPYKDLDMQDLDALKQALKDLDDTTLKFRNMLYRVNKQLGGEACK